MTIGRAAILHARPIQSYADSIADLQELTVTARGGIPPLSMTSDGSLSIAAAALSGQPSFMASNDPVALIRTLPAVATPNDLQATLCVRGAPTGSNLFTSDGIRVINPIHMLGLYSAFNPDYYKSFAFRADRIPATEMNLTGALISASSPMMPDSILSATLCIGLIESHGAIRTPLRKWKSSIAFGFRQSYLNLLFPKILTLGSSTLKYDFTDINASLTLRPDADDILRLDFFANRDAMTSVTLSDREGDKDGRFGWSNLSAGALWLHKGMTTSISFAGYRNKFMLQEGSTSINLPSSMTQTSLRWMLPISRFTIESDLSYRHASGRHDSFEASVAGEWRRDFLSGRLGLEAGLRLSFYHSSGLTQLHPLPRLSARFTVAQPLTIFAVYGRYARFDRLVELTSGGLPADFWACADHSLPPETAESVSAGCSGLIPHIFVSYIVEGYWRRMGHLAEYDGSLINMANPQYDPRQDLVFGNGYSAGISVALMRQFGKISGRIGYNYGVSRVKIPRFGADYIPTSHDRPHDFNINLKWEIIPALSISATFTHATGTPYTRAKYGYLIGENLICEYYPHNSSRLPSYNRLDLGASYTLRGRKGLSHIFSLSVYNATASRNVLFMFTSFSTDKGIEQRRSVMKAVIPSISYTISI